MASLCKLSRLCELNKRNFSNDKNIHILGSKDQAFHLAFIGPIKRMVQLPIMFPIQHNPFIFFSYMSYFWFMFYKPFWLF